MKTTDSAMRESWEEELEELRTTLEEEPVVISDSEAETLKSFIRTTLAEARREWVESVRNKKLLSIAKYGNMPAPHDPTYKEAYNQAIDDVLDLLTGDNPERKG